MSSPKQKSFLILRILNKNRKILLAKMRNLQRLFYRKTKKYQI